MQDFAGPNLSLWKKGLGVVPTWVWERTELETLVLADNGLSDLSGRIGGLKKLRMLDLGHNKLAHLPDALGDLGVTHLEMPVTPERVACHPPASLAHKRQRDAPILLANIFASCYLVCVLKV